MATRAATWSSAARSWIASTFSWTFSGVSTFQPTIRFALSCVQRAGPPRGLAGVVHRLEPFLLVGDGGEGLVDGVGDVRPPVFLRPARGLPPVVPDRRIRQADVLGEHPDRLADREQLLAPRRVGASVGAHRFDLHGRVPELPLDAAHHLAPVPPQLDQLVVALPGHTVDHPGHPDMAS